MRRTYPILILAAAFAVPAAARDPGQPPVVSDSARSEPEQLEEELIRSGGENGDSHAPGGRPELGPVVLDNPTMSVVALRVGRGEHIRRVFGTAQVPRYRGAMEVGRGATTAALPPPVRLNLTSFVEVESYVPGVMANESIASFNVEALKAPAVAARGYAMANVGNYISASLVPGLNVIQYNPIGRDGGATVNVVVR